MKLMLSNGLSMVFDMFEIKRSTMDFPAILSMGFGTVKVCGLSLDPHPAIGTMMFIF
jgi:hypothetical protein